MNETDPLAAVEAARAKVDAQLAAAEARRAGVTQLAEAVKDAVSTARSPRGEVTVTAQPTGRVVSVVLTEAAESLAAPELSRLLTETVALAQHRAAMDALDRSAAVLGDGSPLVAQMRGEALAAFPEPGANGSASIGYR